MNQETKWYVVYDDNGYFMQETDEEFIGFVTSFWDANWVEVSQDTKFKFLSECKKLYPESKFDALIFFSDGK